ncbi:mechanosensitive ion channel family protein [Kineobactrum salinum]|nr:mechanosensitive ion channel family protein [Kineobactrum salinum]
MSFWLSQPAIRLALAVLAALMIGIVTHKIVYRLLLRLTARLPSANLFVGYTRPPAMLLLPTVFVLPVWLGAPDWRWLAALQHANALVVIGALTWMAMALIQGGMQVIISRHPLTVADNLAARRIYTQARVIGRSVQLIVLLVGVAIMLMTFPGVRAVGASLLASAGLVGIVAAVAAQPMLSNLMAGLQIALSQPIRIDDVLIVEGEWGRVEEITGTYVVLAIWDSRRLIIPLQWFIQHPFENWTRRTAELLGTVFLWLDFSTPLQPLRAELQRICEQAPEWDGRVASIQVTDASERCMQLRILVSAADSGRAWELRCRVREALISFLQREHSGALPRYRAELDIVNRRNSQTEKIDH